MRVLFVSYYYPPSGGPGVQRSLKFSRYLPESGWEPVVLTVRSDRAAFPALDESLLREVPPSIEVHRTSAVDPYGAYSSLVGKERSETVGVGFLGESDPSWRERLGRWIRANVFLPDARVGWVPFATARGRKLLEHGRIHAIWTTGPPHSTHLVGYRLSRRFGLPWIADFRDPWTGIDYADMLPSSRIARRIDAALEARVLKTATAVTVVSPSMADQLGGLVRRRYQLLPNGFDEEDFPGTASPDPDRFLIAHIGSLNEARNPVVLWEALRQLNARSRLPNLRVRLVGRVDPAVFAYVRERRLQELVEHEPYLEHHAAVDRMRRAALLLLVINRVSGAAGILTGKLFEYLGSRRPVLCVGPPDGDAATILRETGAGEAHGYEDVPAVAAMIEAHYRAWEAGAPRDGADPARIARYGRRAQARELGDLLSSLVIDPDG